MPDNEIDETDGPPPTREELLAFLQRPAPAFRTLSQEDYDTVLNYQREMQERAAQVYTGYFVSARCPVDDEIVDAINKGALPGDSVPAPRVHPLMSAFTDVDVRTAGSGEDEHLVMTFSVEGWEGRFGYELQSGRRLVRTRRPGPVHRRRRRFPDENLRIAPDQEGVLWLDVYGQAAFERLDPAEQERKRALYPAFYPRADPGSDSTPVPREKRSTLVPGKRSFRWR